MLLKSLVGPRAKYTGRMEANSFFFEQVVHLGFVVRAKSPPNGFSTKIEILKIQ